MSDIAQPEDKQPLKSEETRPAPNASAVEKQNEYGGPKGQEPTRYGDWEKKGRCIDF